MTVDPKILKRVQSLIRKACAEKDQSEEERRTTSLAAVELIKKHEIPVGGEVVDDDATNLRRRKKPATTPAPTWSPPIPPPPRPTVHARREDWLEIKSPVDGYCTMCTRPVRRGERIWYRPGIAIHAWPCLIEVG